MSASCIGILPLIVAAPFKHAFLFTLLAGNRQGIYSEIQRAEFTSWLYSYSPERKGNNNNNNNDRLTAFDPGQPG